MVFAVLKSFVVVGVLALAAVGGAAIAAVVGLALELIEMSQVVMALQEAVDHSRYYLGAWGVTSSLAALRAIRPFAVGAFQTWFSQVVRNHVEDAMTKP